MLNVHSAGIKPYEKCEIIQIITFKEKLNLCFWVTLDIFKVLFGFVLLLCERFLEIFSPQKPKNITGQLALVTGGVNGLGRELCIRLAKEGCNIIIADVDPNSNDTVKEIQSYNVKAIAYKVDVSDENAVAKLRIDVERDIGPVDILVNNAGLMPLLSLREGNTNDIRKIVDVNVFSHYWMVREFISGMIERRRGHIVGIASMSAIHPMPGASIYSSTKFAVSGFMRAFSEEIRQEDSGNFIKFSCAYPYFIPTRKDLTEAINLRFPAVSLDHATNEIVNGILLNKRTIVIPHYDLVLIQILSHFPDRVMDLVRDYVLNEKETRMFKLT